MKYFDIHSHLNLSPLKEDQGAVLARMRKAEVGTITVGVDYETSKEAVRLAEENNDIWATVGIHPSETSETSKSSKSSELSELAKHPKVVAIGECGLDYFRIMNNEERIKSDQKKLFKKQIELALAVGKPLMIHCRPSKGTMDAYEDLFAILTSNNLQLTIDKNPISQMSNVKGQRLRGNLHFFAGNIDIAKKFLDLGFTFSFDGPITFSRDYDAVIKFLPIESIMAETDAPFAAPAPYRGKINEPAYVIEIVKKIAEIRGEDFEYVRQILFQNALDFYKLKVKNQNKYE